MRFTIPRALLLALALAVAVPAAPGGAATAPDSTRARTAVARPKARTTTRRTRPVRKGAPGTAKRPATPPGHAPALGHSKMTAPPHGILAPGTDLTGGLRMRTVTLHIFNRVFANFHDQVDARLQREFRVGDSEYTATVLRFVPDFTMDLKTRRIQTRSHEPNNPAFQIVVKKKGVPQDTTWAFLNVPPHFARTSLMAFLATQVTFENHAPVVSRDSLALKVMQKAR